MSWEKTEKKSKEIYKLAQDIDSELDVIAKRYSKLEKLIHEAYLLAPKKDTQYFSSPLGPDRVLVYLKSHLINKGLQVSNMYTGDIKKQKNFIERIQEGLDWLLKFKGEEDGRTESRTNTGSNTSAGTQSGVVDL